MLSVTKTRFPVADRFRLRILAASSFGLIVLQLCGCGPKLAQISGRVTLDGKPLEQGTVVFYSAGASAGVGTIGPDGVYTVKTGTQQGLAPGNYRVTVTAFEPVPPTLGGGNPPAPPLITPPKYNKAETSGLAAEVTVGSNRCDFELTSG